MKHLISILFNKIYIKTKYFFYTSLIIILKFIFREKKNFKNLETYSQAYSSFNEFHKPKNSKEFHNKINFLESEAENIIDASNLSSEKLLVMGMLRACKSDLRLAKNLIIQADVSSNCKGWAVDKYENICSIENNHIDNKDLDKTNGKPFNFLIVHSGQAGTTAVQSFLCLHPDLLVTEKSEIDFALKNSEEHNLAKKYNQRALNASYPIKTGIVQHGYVVGRKGSENISGKQPGPEIIKRISKVVDTKCFYHLVRNPIEALKSNYNHTVINKFAGGYNFPGSINFPSNAKIYFGDNLLWPSSLNIPASNFPETWKEKKIKNKKFKSDNINFSLTSSECDHVAKTVFKRLKYCAVGEAYKQSFGDWIPFDIKDLSPENSYLGIPMLFRHLGVNHKYWHPIFKTRIITNVRRAMLSNFINLHGLDHPLFVHLDFTGQALFSNTFSGVELARTKLDSTIRVEGLKNQSISLVASVEQWMHQSLKTRKRLIESGVLKFVLDNFMLPAWFDIYPIWEKEVVKYQIENWQEFIDMRGDNFQKSRNNLKEDINSFIKFHSGFGTKWGKIPEML